MPFDGNGNWTSNYNAEADRDANIKILASRFDNILLADLAQSFENCLTKDTQIKPRTNFNANNYRVINVADPTSDKDAVNKQTLESTVSSSISTLLATLYPVGSLYIGTQSTCPMSTLIPGSTWVKVEGRYLLASGTIAGTEGETYSANQYVSAGMPNHRHYLANGNRAPAYTKPEDGTLGDSSNSMGNNDYSLCGFSDTSTYAPDKFLSSTAVYTSMAGEIAGNAETIRPAAYVVNVWRRTV